MANRIQDRRKYCHGTIPFGIFLKNIAHLDLPDIPPPDPPEENFKNMQPLPN